MGEEQQPDLELNMELNFPFFLWFYLGFLASEKNLNLNDGIEVPREPISLLAQCIF